MKKILSGLLAMALLFACLPMGAAVAAGDTATLLVEDATVGLGDTFTVAVRIADNPGIAKAMVWVSYDSTVLELIGHAAADFPDVSFSVTHNYDPYQINWTSPANINVTTDGALALLTFTAKAPAPCRTTVRVDYSTAYTTSSSGLGTTFATKAGTITIGETVPGDVDGNGTVNVSDAAILQQYLSDWDVAIDVRTADVKGDGALNNRDLVVLQRYLNGWDVTLDAPAAPPVPEITLPAAGYDLDGRSRICVKESYVLGRVAFVALRNASSKWITEETAKVEYVCYDAAGVALETDYLYLGSIDTKKKREKIFAIVMPEGTAEIRLGKASIIYWTEWS